MDIKLENISKTFFTLKRGRISALQDIDLDIKSGEFFVFLGPSGCGKSTLLNIVAGIEKNDSGRISIGGKVAADADKKNYLPPGERDVAMVFQSYALYPHLTAYENIAFPLRIARYSGEEIDRKVNEAADKLKISPLLDAKPGELSGGQRQRIALGRAIVREPRALLLDEPLSNLDALLRIDMRAELKKLQRDLGVTTLYVTHDQTEAMSLGDRIAVLRDGGVMQAGIPEKIYSKPENIFVAEFVGTPPMNILRGEAARKIIGSLNLSSPAGEESLVAGIRPEHIDARPSGKGGGKGLKAKIEMIGPPGNEYMLYADFMGRRIIVKGAGEGDYSEGGEVSLSIDREKVYLFSEASGKIIR